MPKKISSTKKIPYPKIINQNKALCKAVSLLPASPTMSLPVAYVKALPMVIGVVTLIVILIMPTTRSLITEFSKNSSEHFSQRTDVLKNQMAFSLESGIDSYISQIKNNINILPIDSDLESRKYLGRAEVAQIKRVNTKSFSEKAHFLTANISGVFEQFIK